MSVTFNVFFEDPFWVGIFVAREDGAARYARVVFGKEPSDAELYAFILKNYNRLEFSAALPSPEQNPRSKNPKRRQREAAREIHDGAGVKKSYQAARLALEQGKKHQQRETLKEKKEALVDYKRDLKQEKRKQKHRGH